MIYQNKAEMLENGSGFIHTSSREVPVPSVIRLASIVKRPYRLERKLTRMEIFKRDRYACQYCGKETRQLTIDHVIPRSRGGQQTWENMVSACIPCNRHKAGRTPEEAGMKLSHKPVCPPGNGLFYIPIRCFPVRGEWQKYLPAGAS